MDMPEKDPEFSVIIPFLNQERFLSQAVGSVFIQTHPDWEIILVDDGSSGEATALAQDLAGSHARVRYLEHEGHLNLGMSASRNAGIRAARGRYLSFLDADDVFLPYALEEQKRVLDRNPQAALVYGPVEWWYSWTGRPEDRGRDRVDPLPFPPDTVIPPPRALSAFLRREGATPSGFAFRRELTQRVGLYEESFRTLYEDQAFCAKVCLQETVFAAGRCWYRYRQHPDSSCRSALGNGEFPQARRAFLGWLSDYMEEKKPADPELHSALRSAREACLSRPTKPDRSRVRTLFPPAVSRGIQWLARRWKDRPAPGAGRVRFGDLRRLQPLDSEWGFRRGLPIDRYYIHKFLERHRRAIQGVVLEIGDDTYTRMLGGDRVERSEILHVTPGRSGASLTGDLTRADQIGSSSFDCVILTQTLQVIYDMRAAVRTLARILKPGGTVLVTVPGISKISRYDMDRWGYFWSLTSASARRLFQEFFSADAVQVERYGNVFAAAAFLYGVAAEEIRPHELDFQDPDYEVIIGVCAGKSSS